MLLGSRRISAVYMSRGKAASVLETFLLEQLDAFARTGTLSRAAEELHITQPALSRNMKKLEESIGVPLFDRANRKISLNATGEVAARCARRALDANRKVTEMSRDFDRKQRAVVVGSPSLLPLADVVLALRDRFPERHFASEVVEDADLLAGLRSHAYHLAGFHGRPHGDQLFCKPLFEERLGVLVPREHPWASRDSIAFEEIGSSNIISSVGTGHWGEIVQQHVHPGNLLIQQNLSALSDLIRSSSMPTFWSDRMERRGMDQFERILVPISDDDALAVYYLACLASEKKHLSDLFDGLALE